MPRKTATHRPVALGLILHRLLFLLQNPRLFRNRLWKEFRQRWGISWDRRFRQGFSGAPVTLTLDLTRRCNLKCHICTQHTVKNGPSWYNPDRELPLSAWINLLDQVVSFHPEIYLTGGEPTLYKDFQRLVKEAKKRGLPVQLQTNGTRLSQLAEFLVKEGVDQVIVSLDGPEEIHDLVRGQTGLFRRIKAGIADLMEAKNRLHRPSPALLINCAVSKSNVEVLDQMVPIALYLGAEMLGFAQTIFNTNENLAQHNLVMSPLLDKIYGVDQPYPVVPEIEFYQSEIGPEDIPILCDRIEQAFNLAQGRIKLKIFPNMTLEQLGSYYLDLKFPTLQKCDALWRSCHILPDGTMSPCLNVVAGNIKEQTFWEIWNGPRMSSFRKIIRQHLLPGCARCCLRCYN